MSVVMVNATNLLPYEPSTDPKPLRVSSAEEPEYGSVNINVGGGITTSAWCNKITVRVPVGAGAEHLTTEGADIKTGASTGWTPSAPTVSGGFAVITFTPARAVQFTGNIVTLTLSNIAVNRAAGQVTLEITEESSPTNGNFTAKSASVVVDKFPAGFVFRNFAPEKIMVENGEAAVLHWEGSEAKYTMYWGGAEGGVPVDKERTWTTPKGLSTVTGFMLQAGVTAGGVTLTHTLTTAVTVRVPDLEVRKLTVGSDAFFSGLGQFQNMLHVSGAGTLKVDGTAKIIGGRFARDWPKWISPTPERPFVASAPTDGTVLVVLHQESQAGQYMEHIGDKVNLVLEVDGIRHLCVAPLLAAVGEGTDYSLSLPVRAGEVIRMWPEFVGWGSYGNPMHLYWWPFGKNTDLVVTSDGRNPIPN